MRTTRLFLVGLSLAAGAARAQPDRPDGPGRLDEIRRQAPGVFSKPTSSDQPGATPREWSIVMVGYRGDDADEAAQRALGAIQAVPGLEGAFVERRGETSVVALGKYAGPKDERAKRDLERVRGFEADGTRPFEGAALAPPVFSGEVGSAPDYELAGARARLGASPKKELFTLQVAAYERGDKNEPTEQDFREIRAAAEKAAVDLRREGVEAYYFHGPRRSMVTVGVFSREEYDASKPGRPVESPRVSDLRRRFPLNLVNGQGYLVRTPADPKGKLQPSFMVGVP